MAKKSSYWQGREEQERRWQMKQLADDERYIGQIRSQYEAAIRRINDDINNQLQWLATRSGQPYAEMQKEVDNLDIQRASQDAQKLVGRANQLRGQGRQVTYGDFSSEENARMRLYNATMRINRLEFLKSEVGLELTQLTGELNTSLGLKLTDDARKEFKRQAGIMGEQLGNAKPWTSFQPQVLVMKNVQGGNWSQRLWKNQDVLKANLDAVLSAGFISGESNQKMAQRLRKAVRSTMENQRYVTERLVRTESARVAYDVQRESIEANGFKWVEWFAEPSACAVCARLARADNGEGPGIYPLKKVPKIPQDTHPNCRCSIGSYYSDKMLDKKLDELGFGKNNIERSSSLRIGNNSVNESYIHSKEYKEKFNKISNNQKLNRHLYKQAVAMLTHRQNTDGEDSFIFDSNGKILNRAFGKEGKLEVGVPKKVIMKLKDQYGERTMIGMHNHPTNIPPSGSDFAVAGYRSYDFGIVITHDGRVYKYSSGSVPFAPTILDRYIELYENPPYNLSADEAIMKTLNRLRRFGLKCEKL